MRLLIALAMLLAALIAAEAWARRGRTRPLAHRFAAGGGRRMRPVRRLFGWGGDYDIDVPPMPEDESYAARWYAAFGSEKENRK